VARDPAPTTRPAVATHAREDAADLRTVQALLGHREVGTPMTATHVLDRGPHRANRRRAHALARCRDLLHAPAPAAPPPDETAGETVRRHTGTDLLQCPVCGEGTLRVVAHLAPGVPAPESPDTS